VASFETNGMRIGTIVLDCGDLKRLTEFWSAALGYDVAVRDGRSALLRHPAAAGPKLLLQWVPEPKTQRNRVYLDLYAVDADRVVEWLTSLGAQRLARHDRAAGARYVFADPEGNEFEVTTAGRDGFNRPFA
jgi:catechol-2,3-dioxygenase